MKLSWRKITDEEFIQRIRFRERLFSRLKWAVLGFMLIGALIFSVIMIIGIKAIFHEGYSLLTSFRLNSYEAGYIPGFIAGSVAGGGIAYFTLGLITIAGEIRRDRLILAYHDRLQHARLLPGESGETIDVDPTAPRS